ncbi:MAG: serine hydrolase [Acidobacteria bacterium]|nr:serine hydrolase [Acidobacteriota bacterium]
MMLRSLLLLLSAAVLTAAPRGEDPAAAIRRVMDKAIEAGEIPGAVVIVRKDGRNVVELAAGYAVIEERREMRPDDLFMIASSTKPFTATTIMTLVDAGKLSLDDPVRKFYPEFAGSSTIRQLLSHTSGIFGNDAPREMVEPIRNFDRSLSLAVDLIVKKPLLYEPGSKFSYGGASFCVAAGIAQKLTGREFDDYMRSVLFEPLGIREACFRSKQDLSARVPQMYERTQGGFEPKPAVMELPGRRGPRPDGFILAAGGLYASPLETVRFLEMHLNGGVSGDRRILSRASVEAMQARQTGDAREEYGLGWKRGRLAPDGQALGFGHGGAYGTQLLVDRERGLVAAIFTQMPSAQARDFIAEVQKTIEALYE